MFLHIWILKKNFKVLNKTYLSQGKILIHKISQHSKGLTSAV